MTKRPSEAELGAALNQVDLTAYVHRLPDPKMGAGVSNWKPCDFMVWYDAYSRERDHSYVASSWWEAKDTPAVNAFPFADIRPSQLNGIRDADRIGIPYWLAIWWRVHRAWTISNAAQMIRWRDAQRLGDEQSPPTSIPRELLMSRFGIETKKETLVGTLKAALLGDI